MNRILVLGKTGQVGKALLQILRSDAMGIGRMDFDLLELHRIQEFLNTLRPHGIINAAAYTAVDLAESEKESAFALNAEAPEIMAKYCLNNQIPFVHFSTDYVYSGKGNQAWKETDQPEPLNTYGRSKWEGEKRILRVFENKKNAGWMILRTSWIYDSKGKNFFNTVLKLALEKEVLRIVNDQLGSPTYAPELAEATLKIFNKALERKLFPSGIYHLCSQGVTSWYDFAREIVAQSKNQGWALNVREIQPISTDAYFTAAIRPRNSRLDTSKVFRKFKTSLRRWDLGLADCMSQIDPAALASSISQQH